MISMTSRKSSNTTISRLSRFYVDTALTARISYTYGLHILPLPVFLYDSPIGHIRPDILENTPILQYPKLYPLRLLYATTVCNYPEQLSYTYIWAFVLYYYPIRHISAIVPCNRPRQSSCRFHNDGYLPPGRNTHNGVKIWVEIPIEKWVFYTLWDRVGDGIIGAQLNIE